jgi:hypothetical protein
MPIPDQNTPKPISPWLIFVFQGDVIILSIAIDRWWIDELSFPLALNNEVTDNLTIAEIYQISI